MKLQRFKAIHTFISQKMSRKRGIRRNNNSSVKCQIETQSVSDWTSLPYIRICLFYFDAKMQVLESLSFEAIRLIFKEI